MYQILYQGADSRQAAVDLMGTQARHELAGRKWKLFSLFRRRKRVKAA